MTKEQLIKYIIDTEVKHIEDKVKDNKKEMIKLTEESLVNALKGHNEIEDLLNNPLVFVYSESDDEFATYTYNFNEIKQVIEAHNEDFDTDYKTINEFNEGEEYRTIKTI